MFKTLSILWIIAADLNLIEFLFISHNPDHFTIALLEGLLAWKNWNNYKGDA